MDFNKDGYFSPKEMKEHYKKVGVYKQALGFSFTRGDVTPFLLAYEKFTIFIMQWVSFRQAYCLCLKWGNFIKNNDVTMHLQLQAIKWKVIQPTPALVDCNKVQTGQSGKEIRFVRMIQNLDFARGRVRLKVQ